MDEELIENTTDTPEVDNENKEASTEKVEVEKASAVDGLTSEVDILRSELEKAQESLANVTADLEDYKKKHLRALAEAQTARRRVEQEIALAKEQGASSIILAVLPVYDDLRRALEAASEDSSKIIPGVEQVRETLKRNLENLGIKEVGLVGETFDPNYHEALTTMPTDDAEKKGTIAQIFESGFTKDDRVVRVARVLVFE